MCMSTEYLKFLDVTFYLAPNFNYSTFLKAYNANEEKGYFPYEFFDSIGVLDETTFPPFESFYTKDKGNTIIAGEGDNAQNKYKELKSMFVKNNWTLRDYFDVLQ